MDAKVIILRLRRTSYKWSEANRINEEVRRLNPREKEELRSDLILEKLKGDNGDMIDVINHIINGIDND